MRWLLPTVAALAGCLDLDSRELPKKNPDFRVVGHRGAPNLAAENTIPSYAAALAEGANALEMDLNITADGVVVIWHDRDPDEPVALARQNGLEGLLYVPFVPPTGSPYRVPVDRLASQDFFAQYGYSRDGSSRDPAAVIPTFATFLEWARGQPELQAVYLDLKVLQPAAAAQIVDLAAAAGLADQVTFYAMSIHRPIVEAMIAAEAPGVRVVYDHEDSGALADSEELGLRDLSIGLTPLRSETEVLGEIDAAALARDAKRIDSITVWTLDSPMQMAVFLFHDVDAILTDDPRRLRDIWQATL